ncbi:MAG: hypothetical protein A2Z14_18440 [Chloroflexi bacterium RBG_16_48_8]|nr:MAG: hypothetical protein A2Z14_18440 [Chloroflexi bacterium RBG_16_48_8]
MGEKEYSMMDVASSVCTILNLPSPAQTEGNPIAEIVSSLDGLRKVAILVPDGMGLFTWDLWRHKMPYLDSLHTNRSLILRSVMPSISPVNFATIVSGTDVEGHGILIRTGKFKCETLFDLVRNASRKSAGIGQDSYTGCELMGKNADICGCTREGSNYDIAAKIIEIVDVYEPDFLIAQFIQVDDSFHKCGPSSPSVVPILADMDTRMKELVEYLRPLGYGIIILSDHGQHDLPVISPKGNKGGHGTDSPEDCLVPCTWI